MKKILIIGEGRVKKFDIRKVLENQAYDMAIEQNAEIQKYKLFDEIKKNEKNAFEIEQERSK